MIAKIDKEMDNKNIQTDFVSNIEALEMTTFTSIEAVPLTEHSIAGQDVSPG